MKTLTIPVAVRSAAFMAVHAGHLLVRSSGRLAQHKGVQAGLAAWTGKGLRWAGKASGYASALHAWVEFAGDRRTAPFLKASANTGLALARVHPVLNLSLAALAFTHYPDRAFEAVARRLPMRTTSAPPKDAVRKDDAASPE